MTRRTLLVAVVAIALLGAGGFFLVRSSGTGIGAIKPVALKRSDVAPLRSWKFQGSDGGQLAFSRASQMATVAALEYQGPARLSQKDRDSIKRDVDAVLATQEGFDAGVSKKTKIRGNHGIVSTFTFEQQGIAGSGVAITRIDEAERRIWLYQFLTLRRPSPAQVRDRQAALRALVAFAPPQQAAKPSAKPAKHDSAPARTPASTPSKRDLPEPEPEKRAPLSSTRR